MIEFRDVRFRWNPGSPLILDIPEFCINSGEKIFLEGASGTGKTTFLNILGGIALPEHGSVLVKGCDLTQLSGAARDKLRADSMGIIFQMFNLIPYLTPLDNIILPCRFSRHRQAMATNKSGSVRQEALRLLLQMQLKELVNISSPAFQLSVGQQQRIAAARAQPKVGWDAKHP